MKSKIALALLASVAVIAAAVTDASAAGHGGGGGGGGGHGGGGGGFHGGGGVAAFMVVAAADSTRWAAVAVFTLAAVAWHFAPADFICTPAASTRGAPAISVDMLDAISAVTPSPIAARAARSRAERPAFARSASAMAGSAQPLQVRLSVRRQ